MIGLAFWHWGIQTKKKRISREGRKPLRKFRFWFEDKILFCVETDIKVREPMTVKVLVTWCFHRLTSANIYILFSFPLLREWVVLENWWHHQQQQEEQVRKGGVYKMGTKCPRLTCFKWLGDASSTFHPEWAQATEDQMSHMIQFCPWLFLWNLPRCISLFLYKSTHICEGASPPLFWLEPVGWWDFEWGGIGPSLLVGQVIPYI